jgi:hypothetical protein
LLDGTRLLVVTQPYTGVDTIASLYDVSDASAPALLRRQPPRGIPRRRPFDRRHGATRRHDVARRPVALRASRPVRARRGRALQRNKDIIAQSTVDDWMPRSFVEAADGSFGDMSTDARLRCCRGAERVRRLGISWIASIDMHGDGSPIGSAGIVSDGGTVYASPTSIISRRCHGIGTSRPMACARNPKQPPTLIHKFSLGENGRRRTSHPARCPASC